MPLLLTPQVIDEPLLERLERLQGRQRAVILARNGSIWFLLTVGSLLLLGFLDWNFHLPGLIRALGLFGIVLGSVVYFRVSIRNRLQIARDPLSMSLHVQEYYPQLKDSLASAVQFLGLPEDDDRSSLVLRQEAIKQALRATDRYDFRSTIETDGIKRALFGALICTSVLVGLILFAPKSFWLGVQRIALPYSAIQWPTRTEIEILEPTPIPERLARGDSLELKVLLRGVIPDRMTISVLLDGSKPFDQQFTIPRDEENRSEAEMLIRVEANRLPRNFQFRLRANDAETNWFAVAVLPPPVLVPLNDKPSPQLSLTFPKYTQLDPIELPPGGSLVEAVTGTRITLRGATDRPISRAWIMHRAEQSKIPLAAAVIPFAAVQGVDLPAQLLLSNEAWTPFELTIDETGLIFEGTFEPHLEGSYLLRFEDATGLGGNKQFLFNIRPDPAPVVNLDRPTASKDSLTLLPDAEFTLRTQAIDDRYALKQVFIETRTDRKEAPQLKYLANLPELQKILPGIGGLAPAALPLNEMIEARMRPLQLGFEQRMSLKQFTRSDGTPLQAGDVLVLRVAANDWDDVTLFKQPGRSPEVEIQIVSVSQLDQMLQQAQLQLRGELLQMREIQRDARTKTQEAIRQLQNSGKLRPEDLQKLFQAEQQQQQIRARLNSEEDGLRAEMNRLRQLIQDNHLPRSANTDRIERIGRELDRIGREELEPIEAALTEARKELNESAKPALEKANRHQKEVEDTIKALLEKLEPWSGAGEIRSEARLLQGEIERNLQQNTPLEKLPPGVRRDQLTPEQNAEIDRAVDRQEQINERGRQLIEKTQRIASEKEKAAQEKIDRADQKEADAQAKQREADAQPKNSPAQKNLQQEANRLRAEANADREAAGNLQKESQALQNAIQPPDLSLGLQLLAGGPGFLLRPEFPGGNGEELKQQLGDASSQMRRNEFNRSTQTQRSAMQNLEKIINSLEERNNDDQELLQKKRDQANEKLDNLIDEQERLQKKVKEANEIQDPKQRTEELQKLAEEQEQLERLARELARELNDAQAEDSAEELRRGARQMERARQELEQGQPADKTQEDALERLDDAQRELEEKQEEKQEQLAREKQAELTQEVKAIRERQLRAITESKRIQESVKKEMKWSRSLATSLNDLRDQQAALAEELRSLTEKKFEGMKVFTRMLKQSAEAMDASVERLKDRREEILDQLDGISDYTPDLEEKSHQAILRKQELALKRLDQLLEALDPSKNPAGQANPPKQPQEGGPMPQQNENRPQGNGIPPLAELKALRALQAELIERTAAFDQANPDRSKLSEEAEAELKELEQAQREIGELIESLSPPTKEGDVP